MCSAVNSVKRPKCSSICNLFCLQRASSLSVTTASRLIGLDTLESTQAVRFNLLHFVLHLFSWLVLFVFGEFSLDLPEAVLGAFCQRSSCRVLSTGAQLLGKGVLGPVGKTTTEIDLKANLSTFPLSTSESIRLLMNSRRIASLASDSLPEFAAQSLAFDHFGR